MSIFILIVGTICLIPGLWLVLCCLRFVRVRQVLVIRGQITGAVRRIVVGPKMVFVWPLQYTQSLDLTMQTVHLEMNNILTADLAVTALLDVFYAFDSTLLRAADLDQILPALTNIEKIVESWADYILRSLAVGHSTAELLRVAGRQARLEERLRHTLQDRVQPLGVHIHTIRLLYRPAPMMLEAQLAAARTQLAAQARAQALEMLTTALGPNHDVAHILPLELLHRVQPGETVTALNLSLPTTTSNNESSALHWMLASH